MYAFLHPFFGIFNVLVVLFSSPLCFHQPIRMQCSSTGSKRDDVDLNENKNYYLLIYFHGEFSAVACRMKEFVQCYPLSVCASPYLAIY